MDNRERILELMQKGVLSVEEGLDLIESLSMQESNQTEEKEFTAHAQKEEKEQADADKEVIDEDSTQAEKDKLAEDLEKLANQINQYSVGIDILNKEIVELNSDLQEVEAELAKRKELNDEVYLQTADDLEGKIENDRMINELENKRTRLNAEIKKQTVEKNQRMKDMHSLKMKHWTGKAKQMTGNIDLPEEWRAGASETIDKAGKILDSGSRRLADILRETVEKTKDTMESVDWQEMKIKPSAKEKVSFEHEWLFESTTASILDFKNANGKIEFKPSMNDNIKVSANITIYEKIAEASPLKAFEARSVIDINEENFKFQVPNKNIKADLVVYLPERNYDYVGLNLLNGDVMFNELLARDIYLKVTNGDIVFNQVQASMLEVKATNGNISLHDTHLRDLLLNTENGDIRVTGEIQSLETATVNGDVLLTLHGSDLTRVIARSVQGDLKLSLPKESSLEIEAVTTLGDIQSRLSNTSTSQDEKVTGKSRRFYRLASEKLCRVTLQTNTGNILLKDTTNNTEEKGE